MDLVSQHTYDAILCDLNLESESGLAVSGFEIHDRINETLASRSTSRPLFIFMTGDLLDDAISEQAGQRGSHFLQKPFRIAELLSLLGELLAPATVIKSESGASRAD